MLLVPVPSILVQLNNGPGNGSPLEGSAPPSTPTPPPLSPPPPSTVPRPATPPPPPSPRRLRQSSETFVSCIIVGGSPQTLPLFACLTPSAGSIPNPPKSTRIHQSSNKPQHIIDYVSIHFKKILQNLLVIDDEMPRNPSASARIRLALEGSFLVIDDPFVHCRSRTGAMPWRTT